MRGSFQYIEASNDDTLFTLRTNADPFCSPTKPGGKYFPPSFTSIATQIQEWIMLYSPFIASPPVLQLVSDNHPRSDP